MSPAQRIVKSACDRAAAAVLLLAALPVLALAAGIIKMFSRGPVLFTQERVGLNEQPFRIYKFRTMHVHSPQQSSVTVRNDPRLFRGARFLRKWKIDELPQLLNVLAGTMSLVGPRPTVRDDYERMTPAQRRRAAVKPGLTGLAQVHGGTALFWPERIALDLKYIDEYSLWLDLKILLRTVLLVAAGRADTHPPGDDEWGAAVLETKRAA